MMALSICMAAGVLRAQPRSSAPEQTPRKALLEMLNGGDEAVRRHLTLEVQKKLGDALNNTASAGMNPLEALSVARAAGGENVEGFEAGPVLFSYDNPAQRQKLEVRIDGDDLRGGEDQMRLSLHSFRDGIEEDLPVALRFTLSWKLQQNLWRLNTVTVSATVPIGDPRLFDKARWTMPLPVASLSGPAGPAPASSSSTTSVHRQATVIAAVAPTPAATIVASSSPSSSTAIPTASPARAVSPASSGDSSKMTPLRAVRLIGLAENVYAQKHPDAGFTCQISDLINVGRGIEDGEPYRFMDPEFAQGVYNGYRFSLIGCAGVPARNFQVMAEPLNGGAGRAYCSDATRELRGSDDGNGLTCLAAGKIVQR